MVTINGTAFDLFNYQKTPEGVRMTISNASTADLEEAIGESADIAISDEYRGYGMKVTSMFKSYNPVRHEIEFRNPSLEDAIQQNAAEIELQAGAIAELAELIAGEEQEVEEI